MRSFRLAALLLALVLPALASGQSLGEAAKKERERREKVRESGAGARTLTQEDLAANKGALANDPGVRSAGAEEASADGKAAATASRPRPNAGGDARGEEYWRERAARARDRIAAAEERQMALQRMIRFGQAAQYDESGREFKLSAHRLKQLADAADAELAAARKALEDLLDEGRRAAAMPGWLR
jgi:hypothetical protein